jgi:predicted transcriptional regulator YdeE
VQLVMVERRPTAVAFLRGEDSPEGIRRVWDALERLVPLHGRRFYGTVDVRAGEYRACVELREGDAVPDGLERGTIPGGTYLRARLRGEPPAVYERIPAVFDELVAAAEPDPARPSIEHYRRRDEIDLLLPVR